MNKKAAIQLSVNFLVILIICIVVFGSSIYIVRKFFTHADTIKDTYDERTEKQIADLMDDGSKVVVPFDRKTIPNGEFDTFDIRVLNMINTAATNNFEIIIDFDKAYKRDDTEIFPGNLPNTWLDSKEGKTAPSQPIVFTTTIRNNEQKKFLVSVEPKDAEEATYIFNMFVCYNGGGSNPHARCGGVGVLTDLYDTVHKLYVVVP